MCIVPILKSLESFLFIVPLAILTAYKASLFPVAFRCFPLTITRRLLPCISAYAHAALATRTAYLPGFVRGVPLLLVAYRHYVVVAYQHDF